MSKDSITVYADSQDLQMVFGCALRYALGRKSMSTHLIPEFIKDNVGMLDQKWLINYLEDLCRYERDRDAWGSDREYGYDGLSHYEGWLDLKKFLIDEYNSREFEEPVTYYQYIKPSSLKMYYNKNKIREYIGSCQTINEAVNLMYNFLEERGIVLSHFRNTEKYAVVFFDIGSATEWFELETIEFSEEKPRTEILEKLKEHGYPFADQYDENGKRKFP